MIRPSQRGLLVIGGMLVAGLVFLIGLFWTARAGMPEEYRRAEVGVPAATLRVVSWNAGWQNPGEPVLSRLREVNADYLVVQRISRRDAELLAEALGMKHDGAIQVFYSPTNPGTTAEPGNAILGRHLLYRGRTIRKRAGMRNFGIFVESVVAGNRFLLASVDLGDQATASMEMRDLVAGWEKVNRPPLIIGGFSEGPVPEGLETVVGDWATTGGIGVAGGWGAVQRIERSDLPFIAAAVEGTK